LEGTITASRISILMACKCCCNLANFFLFSLTFCIFMPKLWQQNGALALINDATRHFNAMDPYQFYLLSLRILSPFGWLGFGSDKLICYLWPRYRDNNKNNQVMLQNCISRIWPSFPPCTDSTSVVMADDPTKPPPSEQHLHHFYGYAQQVMTMKNMPACQKSAK